MAAEATNKYLLRRIALVTGANKGLGLEICRQLASKGIRVILTSRDELRGLDAIEKLRGSIPPDSVVFHTLDVTDSRSAACLAEFMKTRFGRLDILVNNAGIIGAKVDTERLAKEEAEAGGGNLDWREFITHTYDSAKECLETNYYGTKATTEALVPLLELSDSPRIVNVASTLGKLQNIPNEWAKGVLRDENLTEERIDEVVSKFLKDLKEGSLQAKEWPRAYIVSKALVNAYTRVLAKKYPKFRINSVCPGYVKTDLNYNNGVLSVEEGSETPVMAALLPDEGPSGVFLVKKEVSPF